MNTNSKNNIPTSGLVLLQLGQAVTASMDGNIS